MASSRYHHHHGAGVEVAARRPTPIADILDSGILKLRVEFYLRRHLLEQPSSSVPRDSARQRGYFMVQSPSSVLAVSLSFRHGVDGREPRRARSDGGLWRDPPVGRNRVLHTAKR